MKPHWNFFERIVCINLPHRTDRRDSSEIEFKRVGVDVGYFEAIPHLDGRIGLIRSLYAIFEQNYDTRNILIFEDDVKFINDPVNKLLLALRDLPQNYELFYFGANRTQPCQLLTSNIKILKGALAAHAVCYSKSVYDRYMAHLKRVSDQGFINDSKEINDVYLTSIQENGLSFMVHPMIATQRPGYSDLEKTNVDYSWMQHQNN